MPFASSSRLSSSTALVLYSGAPSRSAATASPKTPGRCDGCGPSGQPNPTSTRMARHPSRRARGRSRLQRSIGTSPELSEKHPEARVSTTVSQHTVSTVRTRRARGGGRTAVDLLHHRRAALSIREGLDADSVAGGAATEPPQFHVATTRHTQGVLVPPRAHRTAGLPRRAAQPAKRRLARPHTLGGHTQVQSSLDALKKSQHDLNQRRAV